MYIPVAGSDEDALRRNLLAAKGHDQTAMVNLGLLYFLGQGGLTQDKQRALVLMKLAAGQGHVDARVAPPRIRDMNSPSLSLLAGGSTEHGPGFHAPVALWVTHNHK